MTHKDPYVVPASWTKNEDDYLRQFYGPHSATQIGKFLGRTRSAVIGRARRLGLGDSKKKPSLRKF